MGGFSAQAESLGSVLIATKHPVPEVAEWQRLGFTVQQLNKCDFTCLIPMAQMSPKPVYLIAGPDRIDLVTQVIEFNDNPIDGIILQHMTASVRKLRVSKNSPKLLILLEQQDPKANILAARALVKKVNRKSHARLAFLSKDGLTAVKANLTRDVIRHFMGHKTNAPAFREYLDAVSSWQTPPLNNDSFRSQFNLLKVHLVEPHLKDVVSYFYRNEPHQEKLWPLKKYLAFDLYKYRDLRAPGSRYVTLTNLRGQATYLDLELYKQFHPVIVVGLDDAANLFRLSWFYKTKTMYSWDDKIQDLSVRALGPFLYFKRELPKDKVIPLLVRSALTLEGITFSQTDPLAALQEVPTNIRDILTKDNLCVHCHALTVGNAQFTMRAHHMNVAGTAQGGFALPLKKYSPEVLRAFIFEQDRVAKSIGMTPNSIEVGKQQEFFDWVLTSQSSN